MATIPALTLGTTTVRSLDGLYSLNDLHRASGGEDRHRPARFLDTDQTRALVAELQTDGIPSVKTKEGRNGGTYACRELVIAYAAWISAAFHLKVIRVFLDITAAAAQKLALPTPPKLPPRNLLRGRVEQVFHACKFASGNVGLTIRIPDAVYTAHPVRAGQEVLFEFAPGVNPLTAQPLAIHPAT